MKPKPLGMELLELKDFHSCSWARYPRGNYGNESPNEREIKQYAVHLSHPPVQVIGHLVATTVEWGAFLKSKNFFVQKLQFKMLFVT